jgi:hypothetical protein
LLTGDERLVVRGRRSHGQCHPITTRCRAVVLRVLTIQGRGSPLRPGIAVLGTDIQELREIPIVLAPLGSTVSSFGEGIPLVGDGQDRAGCPHAIVTRRFQG